MICDRTVSGINVTELQDFTSTGKNGTLCCMVGRMGYTMLCGIGYTVLCENGLHCAV